MIFLLPILLRKSSLILYNLKNMSDILSDKGIEIAAEGAKAIMETLTKRSVRGKSHKRGLAGSSTGRCRRTARGSRVRRTESTPDNSDRGKA